MPLNKAVDAGQDKLIELLLNTKKPTAIRAKMLMDVVMGAFPDPAQMQPLFAKLLDKASKQGTTAEVAELKAQYEQALAELETGPARPATYIGEADGDLPGPKPRAHVISPDGQERFPAFRKGLDISHLHSGMTVYLDPKGAVVLGVSRTVPETGQAASFVRQLPDSNHVEVTIHDEPFVLYAAKPVLDAIAAEKIKHGDNVLICPRRQFAFAGLPAMEDRNHRFVDESKLPEVIAGRDIGKPHWILPWMLRRLRILMFRPDLLHRYDLRPRVSVLMTGSTGTGKTLTIRAFLYEFYRMIVERTGRRDIGSRVIRVKMSELLSEWLGRADKNIDALFDDIYYLVSKKVKTADGEEIVLPVTVIFEEAEGAAARRGHHDGSGGVYDRIMGTLLQRLDDPTDDLSKYPLIWVGTTNRPDLFDAAMWRRWAGVRAHFPRLDREAASAVLSKKLKPDYPYAAQNGASVKQLRRDTIDQIVTWLFSPNGEDRGVVEITLRDGAKLTKYRRDFLTGAIIEQGVANAIDQAVFEAEEANGDGDDKALGLSPAAIIDSLRSTIDGLGDNLTAMNVTDYVEMPEHTGVASVRRLRHTNGLLAHVAE